MLQLTAPASAAINSRRCIDDPLGSAPAEAIAVTIRWKGGGPTRLGTDFCNWPFSSLQRLTISVAIGGRLAHGQTNAHDPKRFYFATSFARPRSVGRPSSVHSSGIPALRRPSIARSKVARTRGSADGGGAIPDFISAAILLNVRERSETLDRVTGLRLMTGQCKRCGEEAVRKRETRIDRDRPAGPFDRLIVLLEREIGDTFVSIPKKQIWISRTEPCRLVVKVDSFFILSEGKVCVS